METILWWNAGGVRVISGNRVAIDDNFMVERRGNESYLRE